MAISKNTQTNIDDSNLAAYPNGQVKDNTGTGDGFPLNTVTTSDHFEFFDKLMRLANLTFNNNFDNETNGYQFVQGAIALASKSDFILPITTSSGVLQIPTNIDILQLNEKLICQAATDWTAETQIKGTTATLLTVTITRQYKANDYLMLLRTSVGVQLISLVTADNINLIIGENAYLKAASDSDEDAGTSITKATTPESNKYIFTKRVTDPTAAIPFLATETTPGLMSAADKTALDGFTNPVKNVGWFSGMDPGGGTVGAFAPVSGDITTAQITAVDGSGSYTIYRCTVANAMTITGGHSYFVRVHFMSEGTFTTDIHVDGPVCRVVSATQFDFSVQQTTSGGTQNIKVHLEVVQI